MFARFLFLGEYKKLEDTTLDKAGDRLRALYIGSLVVSVVWGILKLLDLAMGWGVL